MIQTFFNEILSKFQCGFCKGFNAQHRLVSMAKNWKEGVDSGGLNEIKVRVFCE